MDAGYRMDSDGQPRPSAEALAVIEEVRRRNAIPDTGQTGINSTVGLIVGAGSAGVHLCPASVASCALTVVVHPGGTVTMVVPGGPASKLPRKESGLGHNAAATKIEQHDLIIAIDPDGKSGEKSIRVMLCSAKKNQLILVTNRKPYAATCAQG